MRLNYDLIREILLCVEENTSLRSELVFIEDSEHSRKLFEDYEFCFPAVSEIQERLERGCSNDALIYHIRYCVQAELLVTNPTDNVCRYAIADLSVKGHDYLNMVRSEETWVSIKRKFKNAGVDLSLGLIKWFVLKSLQMPLD